MASTALVAKNRKDVVVVGVLPGNPFVGVDTADTQECERASNTNANRPAVSPHEWRLRYGLLYAAFRLVMAAARSAYAPAAAADHRIHFFGHQHPPPPGPRSRARARARPRARAPNAPARARARALAAARARARARARAARARPRRRRARRPRAAARAAAAAARARARAPPPAPARARARAPPAARARAARARALSSAQLATTIRLTAEPTFDCASGESEVARASSTRATVFVPVAGNQIRARLPAFINDSTSCARETSSVSRPGVSLGNFDSSRASARAGGTLSGESSTSGAVDADAAVGTVRAAGASVLVTFAAGAVSVLLALRARLGAAKHEALTP